MKLNFYTKNTVCKIYPEKQLNFRGNTKLNGLSVVQKNYWKNFVKFMEKHESFECIKTFHKTCYFI